MQCLNSAGPRDDRRGQFDRQGLTRGRNQGKDHRRKLAWVCLATRLSSVDCIFVLDFLKAKRVGVSTVILPEMNKKDYDDLADFIKADLQVHFVNHYSQVFPIAFPSFP